MSLWKYVSIRDDVFDKTLDEAVAPSLSEVMFGTANKIYVDPEEFINITHLADTLKKLVNEVTEAFVTRTGKVIMLPSMFGGGKTHAMILLYHLIKKPNLLSRILGEQAEVRQRALEDVNIIVIDGMDKRTAPSPLPTEILEEGGVKIKTLWGYLAHKLNAYEKVREYDNALTSPEKRTLSEVLSGKKVLVLIDELSVYYNRLSRVPQPESAEVLRKYADQVIIFLRMLSESAKENNVVVIISIPAEPTERELEAEPGYEDFVRKIEREIPRLAIRAEKPIATNEDFASVLKKRLFNKIDSTGLRLVGRRLKNLYAEHPSLIKDVYDELERYYPFHPLFIATLREVVEKNKDLQKTRDALRIARKVVRNLYGKAHEISLIMPMDIDLRIEEVRVKIITERYSGFDIVVSKIINKAKEIPVEEGMNPDVYRNLAYKLALYVFLRTYVYDPHLEPRSEFPSKSEVITGVYDPARYEQYLISPVVVSELLDKLSSGNIEYRVPHLYGRDGYYWVTRLLDIRERVEKEAEKVEETSAMQCILEEVEALYMKPYEGREEVKATVFSPKPMALLKPALLEKDAAEYTLIVIVTPLEDLKEGAYASGDMYDTVYYKLSGRQKAIRRYANTVAVLFSNRMNMWKDIIKTAKMIIACEKLMDAIRREYTDERVVKILRDELRDMKNGLSKNLKYKLVARYFNLIAYPTVEKGANIVQVERVDVAGRTLIELAEGALKRAGKILEEKYAKQFEVLVSILEGRRQEVKWTKKMKVSDVINAFFENSAFPMIPPQNIREAILSGLKDLKVGVVRDGKVYFKGVRGVKVLSELEDTDIVIPQEEAAEEQIGELSKIEEEVVGDLIVRRYYVAVYGGREIPVKELKSKYPDNYVKIFVDSSVELREEKMRRGFDLEVERKEMELKLEEAPESISTKVLIKRVGTFENEIILKPQIGEIKPSSGIPDFEAVWTIPVPKEPGEYTYVLSGNAKGTDLIRSVEIKLILKRGLRCKPEPPEKISEIRIEGDVEAAALIDFLRSVGRSVQGSKVIRQCSMRTEFFEKKPSEPEKSINIRFKNVTIDDVATVARALKSAFGVTASIKCEQLQLEVIGEGKVIDMSDILSADKNIKQRPVKIEYYW
ncbi:MAG: ATP-binding protein [Candidatus Verstraetearchaeota archaeon]|nr:ATP-binding protein [Candidatus Verstraetearchaeota archaeon]